MPTTEQKKLGFWQVAVAGKDALDIPRGYASASKKGTYDRFTGFVSEFIDSFLNSGTSQKQMKLTKKSNILSRGYF